MLKVASDKVTGRGAGLNDAGFERKKKIIAGSLQKYNFNDQNDEKPKNAIDMSAAVIMTIGKP